MVINELLLLLFTGAIAGIIAGLLGIGGGIIIVPALVFVYKLQSVDQNIMMHSAIGTSLATIVFTSISSIRAHQSHKAILWPVFKQLTPGILLGAFLGSFIADALPSNTLKMMFAPFMILIAIQMALGKQPKPHRQLPGKLGMFTAGSIVGAISSLFGIGGGSLNVPFMTWCNVTIQKAVATSAAVGLPIAIAGSIGFIWSGWGVPNRPEWSLGYINIIAMFSIVVMSALTAPLGAKLAHTLPSKQLKRAFAVVLVVLAIKLFWND